MRLSLLGAPTRPTRLRLLAIAATAALGASLLATSNPAANAAVFTPNNAQPLSATPGASASSSAHQTGAGGLTEDVNVTLTGVTAPAGSLSVTLTGPNDVAVTLMSNNCTALNDATLVFDQQAANSITTCAGSGSYVPLASLGQLVRINPWGNWTVTITDSDTALSAATISGGFSVNLSTSAFQNLLPATGDSGAAKLYPTNFKVKGRTGAVTGVTATLKGISDTSVGDLDALLVSPSGTAIWLMSDACDGTSVTAVDWTFSDSAATAIPASGACGTGTYKPANYDGGDPDTMAAPSPAAATASGLSAFNGQAANGTWALYIMDDNAGSGTGNGTGGGGFIQTQSLIVATAGDATPVVLTPANLDSTAPQTTITHRPPHKVHRTHAHFTFVSSEPGSTFQCKLDRKAWASCATVFRVKKLHVHRHRFKVRAIDSAGNVDETPAVARWRVLSRHLPQHHRPDIHQ